ATATTTSATTTATATSTTTAAATATAATATTTGHSAAGVIGAFVIGVAASGVAPAGGAGSLRLPSVRGRSLAMLAGRLSLLLGLLVVVAPTAAQAHTALQGSDPAAGAQLAYPPAEVVLSFAAPVDPATLTVSLRAADGRDVAVTAQTSTTSAVSTVGFDLPRLAQGVYGLSWESVGEDGHRARGEVLFGVGVAPGEQRLAAAGIDPVATALDVAAAMGRVLWYLALAAVAAVAVLRRARGTQLAAVVLARRRLVVWGLAAAAALRAATAAAIVLQAGGGGRAVLSRSAVMWLGLAAGLVLVALAGRRARPGSRGKPLASEGGPWADWGLLGLAVLIGTLAGHAPGRPDPVLAVTFGMAHLGAAAVWVGPLLAVLVATRSGAWRDLEADQRRTQLPRALGSIVPAAGAALAVVAASGLILALRTLDGRGLSTGAWAVVLVVKALVVVAVVLPLGWVHHRRARSWSRLPRTWRVETAGLLVAVVLGSVLVGVDPGWGGGTDSPDQALAALLDGRAQDPAQCGTLDVGRASCYRTSLTAMMVAEGPQPAIDAVAELSQTDDYVATNCHQVVHDLGRDAAERSGDLGVALAVNGSLCASGYIHGVVEASLATITDSDVREDIPALCDPVADPAYTGVHYNCLHGLGHGLMLRAGDDLFSALSICRVLADWWSVRSCVSGVYMENVMMAQQGLNGTFDEEDLLYPCTAVEDDLVEDCYLMQSSFILWRLDGDLADAFEWCDTAPEGYQGTCYQSMGRDISGRALLEVDPILTGCREGRPSMQSWCFDGAAANAVYDTSGTAEADALCAALSGLDQQRCEAARDRVAATVQR
ncbi:MAG TPA: copper resistance CopC family protein, partial [Euzebya sp.]|nr:copper resistance CopC family protein [Euzebya sp.]